MIKVATERKWVRCPYCNAKHSVYDDTANCHGVFLKCTRGCKREFELIIEDGEQIMKRSQINVTVHGLSS